MEAWAIHHATRVCGSLSSPLFLDLSCLATKDENRSDTEDIINIIFFFIFLSDSNSNTDNVNHVG